jgi:multidrug efflux system membrane fusion protein
MLEKRSLRFLLRQTVTVGVLSGSLLAGCKPAPPPAAMQRPPAAVTVAAAKAQDVPIYLEEIGKTAASEYVTVQPQVAGQLKEIHFVDGADIKKNDLLFTIDPRPFDAALKQADANAVQQRAALELAQQDFVRVKELVAAKAVSPQEFDQKKNAVDIAKAMIEAADASVNIARLNLGYCSIRSPIDGRAGQRQVDVGNIVRANDQSLVVVQRLDPIYVDFITNEQNLALVRQHMKDGALRASVTVPGEAGKPHEGDLTFLDTAVQSSAGTVKLRATLSNSDRYLWAGQFVNVQLVLQVKKDAVLVPMQAIQISQKGPFVFVVNKDSIAEPRPIVQGQRQGDWVVIDKGVAAGERVITTGQMLVAPGAKVHVLEPEGVARS